MKATSDFSLTKIEPHEMMNILNNLRESIYLRDMSNSVKIPFMNLHVLEQPMLQILILS